MLNRETLSEASTPKKRIGPRRRGRFIVMVFLIAFGVQAPLCAALVHLTGRPGPVLAVAGAITFGFIASLFGGRSRMGAPGRLRLYLVLWPFFVWWTLGLLFAALAPLAFLVAAVLHAPLNAAWTAGLGAALIGTLMAFVGRPRLREHEIEIAGLPAPFDGYRVAQISDLHCGPFADGARVDRWVAAVNRLEVGSGGGHRRPHRQRLDVRAGRRGVARQAARPRRRLRLHGQPRLLHRRGRDGPRAGAGGADAAAEPRGVDPARRRRPLRRRRRRHLDQAERPRPRAGRPAGRRIDAAAGARSGPVSRRGQAGRRSDALRAHARRADRRAVFRAAVQPGAGHHPLHDRASTGWGRRRST